MGRITLEEAARWCGGQVEEKYAQVSFFGASNDSRSLQPGQLFLALQGQRDGHDFIPQALEKGAAAVLCTHVDGDYPAIVVKDTRIALGDIAREERKRIGMKVVGVTGSVGKSTTKEMIAGILETTYRTAKTPVNHNNDIGVPMAILGMPEDTQVAVVEMGMNHFGEMAYLTSIARPDYAVIVNIGTMHIEHLGSVEGILQAKLEILEGMQPGSKAFFNGDDRMLRNARVPGDISVRFYGCQSADCWVRGSEVKEETGMIRFRVRCPRNEFAVSLELEGTHFVTDALAAVAVGIELDVPEDKIRGSLSSFRNMEGRQEIFEAKGFTIIKDTYNAGPESLAAALMVLGKRQGRKIAVLGDMLELGSCSQAEHYRIGRIAAEQADGLLAYGRHACRMVAGAITGGMPDPMARSFTEQKDLVKMLKRMARPGDVLLFKGSRGMHMELALEQFLQDD